jgi:hypothetical protein
MLFLADQALHITIALAGWLVILEGEALAPMFVDFVDAIVRSWDPVTFHAAVLTGVVLVSAFLVNTRGAFYFAMALVGPRHLVPRPDDDLPADAIPPPPRPHPRAPPGGLR